MCFSRLSDFLVNEVDTKGEIVHLSKLGMDKDMLVESSLPVGSDLGPLTADTIQQISEFLTSGKKAIEIPVGLGELRILKYLCFSTSSVCRKAIYYYFRPQMTKKNEGNFTGSSNRTSTRIDS